MERSKIDVGILIDRIRNTILRLKTRIANVREKTQAETGSGLDTSVACTHRDGLTQPLGG